MLVFYISYTMKRSAADLVAREPAIKVRSFRQAFDAGDEETRMVNLDFVDKKAAVDEDDDEDEDDEDNEEDDNNDDLSGSSDMVNSDASSGAEPGVDRGREPEMIKKADGHKKELARQMFNALDAIALGEYSLDGYYDEEDDDRFVVFGNEEESEEVKEKRYRPVKDGYFQNSGPIEVRTASSWEDDASEDEDEGEDENGTPDTVDINAEEEEEDEEEEEEEDDTTGSIPEKVHREMKDRLAMLKVTYAQQKSKDVFPRAFEPAFEAAVEDAQRWQSEHYVLHDFVKTLCDFIPLRKSVMREKIKALLPQPQQKAAEPVNYIVISDSDDEKSSTSSRASTAAFPCDWCSKTAAVYCKNCETAVYCGPKCASTHWRTGKHYLNCVKK